MMHLYIKAATCFEPTCTCYKYIVLVHTPLATCIMNLQELLPSVSHTLVEEMVGSFWMMSSAQDQNLSLLTALTEELEFTTVTTLMMQESDV